MDSDPDSDQYQLRYAKFYAKSKIAKFRKIS